VVVVVVVVESEPPPGPELDPEEPLSEESWPDPSRPEVVEVPLLPPLLPLPLVVEGTTTVASSEPSRPLPDEPSPEDVPKWPLPELESREPPPRVCDCSSVE